MHKLLTDNSGEKVLLLGNEAMARGLLESGCSFAASYPGTPASEISSSFIRMAQAENSQAQLELAYTDCSPDEKKILNLLREPIARDILISKLEFPTSRANALLSVMEIKGLIKEEMGEMRLA